MMTPREMLRDYMTVLNILMQNESASFADVIGMENLMKPVSDVDEGNPDKRKSAVSSTMEGRDSVNDESGRALEFHPEDIVF